MKTRFELFLKWGIRFGEQFLLPEHSARKVQYAGREKLEAAIARRYPKAEDKRKELPAEEFPAWEATAKSAHRRPPRTD